MNKLLSAFAFLFLFSCVSSKKFNQLNGNYQDCQKTVQSLKEQNQALEAKNTELQSKINKQIKDIEQINVQLKELSQNLDDSKSANERLKQFNSDLEKQLSSLKTGSSEEIARLMSKLQEAQADVQKREETLAQRTQRLQELEEILRQKDEAVKQLKQKVMDALLGFNNKGLTIQEKNGKVYVSLDEQLLFKTGQWVVDPKGQQALANLADVLAQNPDINVMVEGHTDNVPMKGAGEVKDNWDLSVVRATAVTKILLKNKDIDPKRITSAGHGEFFPIDDANTPEARQKNRRTEIILTPKLDELFKILESN
ncbi:MAG TPA: OmpA family protein [Prolixibacteraceae bacterium]|nr:OmpA family protein [Prolixibacteraceae bacterium]